MSVTALWWDSPALGSIEGKLWGASHLPAAQCYLVLQHHEDLSSPSALGIVERRAQGYRCLWYAQIRPCLCLNTLARSTVSSTYASLKLLSPIYHKQQQQKRSTSIPFRMTDDSSAWIKCGVFSPLVFFYFLFYVSVHVDYFPFGRSLKYFCNQFPWVKGPQTVFPGKKYISLIRVKNLLWCFDLAPVGNSGWLKNK